MEGLIGIVGLGFSWVLGLWLGATFCLPFYVWAIHRRLITLCEQGKEVAGLLENLEALSYSQVKGKDKRA